MIRRWWRTGRDGTWHALDEWDEQNALLIMLCGARIGWTSRWFPGGVTAPDPETMCPECRDMVDAEAARGRPVSAWVKTAELWQGTVEKFGVVDREVFEPYGVELGSRVIKVTGTKAQVSAWLGEMGIAEADREYYMRKAST